MVYTPPRLSRPWYASSTFIVAAAVAVTIALVAIMLFVFFRASSGSSSAVAVANAPRSVATKCADFRCSDVRDLIPSALAGSFPDASDDPSAFRIIDVNPVADPNPAHLDSASCKVTYQHGSVQKTRRMSFAPRVGACGFVLDGMSMPDGGDFCDDNKCLTQTSSGRPVDDDGAAARKKWNVRRYTTPTTVSSSQSMISNATWTTPPNGNPTIVSTVTPPAMPTAVISTPPPVAPALSSVGNLCKLRFIAPNWGTVGTDAIETQVRRGKWLAPGSLPDGTIITLTHIKEWSVPDGLANKDPVLSMPLYFGAEVTY
jgi:hypothetical protein